MRRAASISRFNGRDSHHAIARANSSARTMPAAVSATKDWIRRVR